MKNIVVIDDDEDVREVIVFALENDGFKVTSFSNGRLGLEGLLSMPQSDLPGLIIVDYLMPEMDGLTFLKTIKESHQETLGHIPVAISSAMGGFDPSLTVNEGVILLHKPMDLDDLINVAEKNCH